MHFDRDSGTAIDALGWVDKGSLWAFDATRRTARFIPVPGADYVSISAGPDGWFRVVHHGGPRPAISVRRFADPVTEVARVDFDGVTSSFSGEDDAWSHIESAAVLNTANGQQLVSIEPGRRARILDIDWYLTGDYDHGYQGLTCCVARRDAPGFIVSVQRSSDLVLLDAKGAQTGIIPLTGARGNPDLIYRDSDRLIATDYDAVAECFLPEQRMTRHVRLQSAAAGTQQFIGAVAPAGPDHALVARPFSGDIVRLSLTTFEVEARAAASLQPLSVCPLDGDQFLYRDWQTGRAFIGWF